MVGDGDWLSGDLFELGRQELLPLRIQLDPDWFEQGDAVAGIQLHAHPFLHRRLVAKDLIFYTSTGSTALA